MSRAITPPSASIGSTTTVHAGRGTAAAILCAAAPGDVAVLYEPAVEHLLKEIGRLHPHHRLACRRVDRPPMLTDLDETVGWLQASPAAALVAVGGGRVLDLAKLAVALAGTPGSVRHLGQLARRAGYAPLPGALTTGLPLLAVPTTLGTGAEVSSVAVVSGAGGDRTLVYSPSLRPTVAVLDPLATSTLPGRLAREGALEAMLRVAGAHIGCPSSVRMANTEALLLTRQLAQALDECGDEEEPGDDLRLFIAQLSNATHRGWALAGRSPFPSPLWFLAAELSAVLGVTKIAATAMLLPAWLERVAAGDARWGDHDRLTATWPAMSGTAAHLDSDVAGATRSMLRCWHLEPERVDAGPDAVEQVSRRLMRRWGGRLPMLGRFGEDDLGALVGDALAALPADIATARM